MALRTERQKPTDPPARKALFLPHLDVLAHTGRSLLIAKELALRGWRVAFAGAGRYSRLVEAAGLAVMPLPEMPAAQLVAESRRGQRWPFHAAAQVREFVDAEVALLTRFAPYVVVFDHRYTAGISAQVARIPRVAVTNLWWTPYDAVGMGLPETHPVFVAHPGMAFLRRYRLARAAGRRLTRIMFARWAAPYNTVCRERGLTPMRSILDLFTGDAVVLPDSRELTPASDLPDSYHYIGPLVWEPDGALPAELADLEGHVYVTMGSSADPKVFDVVIDALALLDVPAVVTTGGVRRPDEFRQLPARIRLYDFLPGSLAAAKASVVVCQGGIGTIYQALAAGKPLVGIPFMPEQEVYGIGAVARLGAGLSLSARSLSPRTLADAIREVLSTPRYRAAALAISPRIDLVSGPSLTADVIEKLPSLS